MPRGAARNDTELLDLETRHQVVSMYLWLSNHFEGDHFPYVKKAETMATDIAELLGKSLLKVCWKPESRCAQNSKPEVKDAGYQRPMSIIQLRYQNREENSSTKQKPEKVTA